MCGDNGNPFIVTLHNVLLEPELCDGLFSTITLMNLGHTYLFHKVFCMVYLEDKKGNAVIPSHSVLRKHSFLVKINEMSK